MNIGHYTRRVLKVAGVVFLLLIYAVLLVNFSGYAFAWWHSAEAVPASLELMDIVAKGSPEQMVHGSDERIPMDLQKWHPYFVCISHDRVKILSRDLILNIYRNPPAEWKWRGLRVTERLYWYMAGCDQYEMLLQVAFLVSIPLAIVAWAVHGIRIYLRRDRR